MPLGFPLGLPDWSPGEDLLGAELELLDVDLFGLPEGISEGEALGDPESVGA